MITFCSVRQKSIVPFCWTKAVYSFPMTNNLLFLSTFLWTHCLLLCSSCPYSFFPFKVFFGLHHLIHHFHLRLISCAFRVLKMHRMKFYRFLKPKTSAVKVDLRWVFVVATLLANFSFITEPTLSVLASFSSTIDSILSFLAAFSSIIELIMVLLHDFFFSHSHGAHHHSHHLFPG